MTLVVTFQMGGAINRVGSTDTAYGERSAPVDVVVRRQLGGSRGQRRQHRLGARELQAISPYSTGTTYTNFTGQADESASALASNAYGANMARLRLIKAQYDPDNFFRINANIAPAAAAPV